MFIGHYAVALAAKKAAPRTSLGTLFLAVQFVDLLWPLFLLLGLEHVRVDPGNTEVTPLDFSDYPYTHSLLGVLLWSVALGALYFALRRYKAGALVVAVGVFSHWILDFITHRPDLPLAPGSETYFGLGLWNSVAGTIVVELALFVTGLILYARATAAKNKIGIYGFWSLAGLLALIWIANILGPPPPDESVLPVVALSAWLFVFWAYWADRNREPRSTTIDSTP